MKPAQNPLFDKETVAAVPADKINNHLIHKGRIGTKDIRKIFRLKTAAEAIGDIPPGVHIFGLTKGQFSIIDILEHIADQIGTSELTMSTWTAARSELDTVAAMLEAGTISNVRLLVDFSFQRRAPALLNQIRETFGNDSIRVSKCHAKFYMLKSASREIIVRTSMNLNFNPRLEDFTIEDDKDLYAFLDGFINEMFDRPMRKEATTAWLGKQFKKL